MFRQKSSEISLVKSDSIYNSARRKLRNLTTRQLTSQLDMHLTDTLTVANSYMHQHKEEQILEMKRTVIVLMAVVDELHDDLKTREEAVRLLPY
jgi:hypothetical protein